MMTTFKNKKGETFLFVLMPKGAYDFSVGNNTIWYKVNCEPNYLVYPKSLTNDNCKILNTASKVNWKPIVDAIGSMLGAIICYQDYIDEFNYFASAPESAMSLLNFLGFCADVDLKDILILTVI